MPGVPKGGWFLAVSDCTQHNKLASFSGEMLSVILKLLSTTDFCFLHLGCPLPLHSTVTTLCSVGLAFLVTLTTETYEDATVPQVGDFLAFVRLNGHLGALAEQHHLALDAQAIFLRERAIMKTAPFSSCVEHCESRPAAQWFLSLESHNYVIPQGQQKSGQILFTFPLPQWHGLVPSAVGVPRHSCRGNSCCGVAFLHQGVSFLQQGAHALVPGTSSVSC